MLCISTLYASPSVPSGMASSDGLESAAKSLSEYAFATSYSHASLSRCALVRSVFSCAESAFSLSCASESACEYGILAHCPEILSMYSGVIPSCSSSVNSRS